MSQKTNQSSSFLKCVIPLLMLAVFFFGCGVLPPVISSITVSPLGRVVAESSVSISAEATSGSGLDLSYTWSANGGNLSSNTGKSIVWTAPVTSGVYVITLTVSDGTNSVSETVNIVVMDPDAPIINDITYSPSPVATSKEIVLTCTATDPGGLTLEYSWSASAGTLIKTRGESVQWISPSTAGTYSLRVTVTNTKSLSDYDELNLPVVVPQKPIINNLTATAVSVAQGGTVDLACYAQDLDGFDLTYRWTKTGGSFSEGDGSTTTWTAPDSAGSYTITVTAFNGYSRSDEASVAITVN